MTIDLELTEFEARWGPVVRRPTVDEAKLFERGIRGDYEGDAVMELYGPDASLEALAKLLAEGGHCDAAHVIPGVGIYLEE